MLNIQNRKDLKIKKSLQFYCRSNADTFLETPGMLNLGFLHNLLRLLIKF